MEFRTELFCYFLNNVSDTVAPFSIWTTNKCFIRGVLIKIVLRRKKEFMAKLELLLKERSSLKKTHKKSQSLAQAGQLKLLRNEIKKLVSNSLKRKLLSQKQMYYEYGYNAGRLLACSIRREQARSFIPVIISADGRHIMLSSEIAICSRNNTPHYINCLRVPHPPHVNKSYTDISNTFRLFLHSGHHNRLTRKRHFSEKVCHGTQSYAHWERS